MLALGVLDALAAAAGRKFGRVRWPGTRKTAEGTAVAIIGTTILAAVVIAATASATDCAAPAFSAMLAVGVGTVAAGLLEAFTLQNDNILLPVYFFVFLGSVSPNEVPSP